MSVTIDIDAHVALVRLARPEKMNALNPDMFDQLIAAGDSLRARRDVRCIVLAGEGRAFCAGIDRQRFSGIGAPPPLSPRTHGLANLPQMVALQWRELAPPVIAAVHGVAFGAGFQLALGADMRYAAPDTKMSLMEVEWGLVPDMGGTVLMSALVGEDVARELTYSATVFSGTEAKDYGLVTRVMDDPLAAAMKKAHEIAGKSPSAVQHAKRLFNRRLAPFIESGLLAESLARDALVVHPNQREAAEARLAGRQPRFVDPTG